jgi:hypothetical protein
MAIKVWFGKIRFNQRFLKHFLLLICWVAVASRRQSADDSRIGGIAHVESSGQGVGGGDKGRFGIGGLVLGRHALCFVAFPESGMDEPVFVVGGVVFVGI